MISWFNKLFPKKEVKIENVIPIKPKLQIICPVFYNEYETKYAQAIVKEKYANYVVEKVYKINQHFEEYLKVEIATGIPWKVVATIHCMESNLDFECCLHNGERIIGTGKKTSLVPKLRGPFDTWHDAAIDALGKDKYKDLDWDLGFTLEWIEKYNGLGYRAKKLDSPYLWSLTTEQLTKGKYTSDGKFDPDAESKQIGAVVILKGLAYRA